jgi:large repetitive protein
MRSRRFGSIVLAAMALLPLAAIAASPAGAASVPGKPTAVSAVPLSKAAKVVWKAPVDNGGSAITGYVVTPYLGTVAQPARSFVSAQTNQVITGLANGKKYSFTVAARNAIGKGAPSARSGTTIVGAPGRPGTPTIQANGSQLPGDISVAAASPLKNGAVITKFTAICTSANGGAPASGVREPAVHIVLVSGLTHGKTYRCTMTATNARGTGPSSLPSKAYVFP